MNRLTIDIKGYFEDIDAYIYTFKESRLMILDKKNALQELGKTHITDEKILKQYLAFEEKRANSFIEDDYSLSVADFNEDELYDFEKEALVYYQDIEGLWEDSNVYCQDYLLGNILLDCSQKDIPEQYDFVNLGDGMRFYNSQTGKYAVPVIWNCDDTLSLSYVDHVGTSKAAVTFKNIALRWLCSKPLHGGEVSIIDPVNRGKYYGNFLKLIGDNDMDICKIFKDDREIISELEGVRKHIDKVITELSSEGFDNIYEYNNANNNNAITQKLLVINDYPHGISYEAVNLLKTILDNAKNCGISVLFNYKQSDIEDVKPEIKEIVEKYFDEYHDECLCISETNSGVSLSVYVESEEEEWEETFENVEAILSDDFIDEIRTSFNKKPEVKADFAAYVDINNVEAVRRKHLDTFGDAKEGIHIPFAVDQNGKLVYLELDSKSRAHGFLSGATGSGKSSALHTIILNAAIHYSPKDIELWLLDYKSSEFRAYAKQKLPQVKCLIADNSDEISNDFLRLIWKEIERRNELFSEKNVRDFTEYRKLGTKALPRILIVIDECHRLTQFAHNDSEAKTKIVNLFKECRSCGINIFMSDQHENSAFAGYSTDVGDNISVRVAMKDTNIDNIKATIGVEYNSSMLTSRLKEMIEDLSCGATGEMIYGAKPDFVAAKGFSVNDIRSRTIENISNLDGDADNNAIYYTGGKRQKLDWSKVSDFEESERQYEGRRSFASKKRLYLGTPKGIEYGFYMELGTNKCENIVLSGYDLEKKYSVVKAVIESAKKNGSKIKLVGWKTTEFVKAFPELMESNGYSEFESYTEYGEICKLIYSECKAIENRLENYDDYDEDEDDELTGNLILVFDLPKLWNKMAGDPRSKDKVCKQYDESLGIVTRESDGSKSTASMPQKATKDAGVDDEITKRLMLLKSMGLASDEDVSSFTANDEETAKEEPSEAASVAGAKASGKTQGYNAIEDFLYLLNSGETTGTKVLCMVDNDFLLEQKRNRIYFNEICHHHIATEKESVESLMDNYRAVANSNDNESAFYQYMDGTIKEFKPYDFS